MSLGVQGALLELRNLFLVVLASTRNLSTISVDKYATLADSFNVQVKLCEGWCLLQHHHGAFALVQ